MRTVFFIPPLRRVSGGLATLYSLASSLADMGDSVAVTCPGEAAGLGDLLERFKDKIVLLPWQGLSLSSRDIFVVPESWPNAVSVGINAGAQTVVYAQSWNFLLTTLPEGVRWKQLPIRFIAVSRPVAWFMETILEVEVAGVLPPAVNPVFITPPPLLSSSSAAAGKVVRVAWMPRKNRALAEQAQKVAEAALARDSSSPRLEWVSIHNMSQKEAADLLRTCSLFLTTSFPEGFGLPPVEAMACGCIPVGFTGFGGWEYMRQADMGHPEVCNQLSDDAFLSFQRACRPPFPPSDALYPEGFFMDLPIGGNGFYVNDGDIMGAGLGVAYAALCSLDGGLAWEGVRQSALETAGRYTPDIQKSRMQYIWPVLTT